MKKKILPYLIAAISLISLPAFAQEAKDTASLGLPGDNLDLYGVLDLFQKSKTIEAFEKSLNEEKSKVNNLDLDLDKKVDFIKVVTKQKDSSFTFILQVDVSKKETQDVAVILVDKLKNQKVSIQIVGDEELYGKDYVIEPKGNSSITSNPGYTGSDPVTVNVPGYYYGCSSIAANCAVCIFPCVCAVCATLLLWILPTLFCSIYRNGGWHLSS
jgi:hypothetical protein